VQIVIKLDRPGRNAMEARYIRAFEGCRRSGSLSDAWQHGFNAPS